MFFLGLTLPQWAAIFTIIGALLGFIKPVRTYLKNLWVSTFGRRGAQLDRIEREVTTNGGGSLKDLVDGIKDRQSEFQAFLSASLNIHDIAIFRCDSKGRVIFTNRAHQRLTGFSQGEAYGEGWVNYLAPRERERMQKIWLDAVKSGRELNEDIWFIRPDHSEYLIRAHVYRELAPDGTIKGWLGVIIPIEELSCPDQDFCRKQIKTVLENHGYVENSRQKRLL